MNGEYFNEKADQFLLRSIMHVGVSVQTVNRVGLPWSVLAVPQMSSV